MVLDLPKMIKVFLRLMKEVHSFSDFVAVILAFFKIFGVAVVFVLYYYTHGFVMLPPSWGFVRRDRK